MAAGCLHYTRHNRRGAVNKWRSGADYLKPYLPHHHGLLLEPLVRSVEDYLEAMSGRAWPELKMPAIRPGGGGSPTARALPAPGDRGDDPPGQE